MNYYYDFKRNIEDVFVCFIIATTAQKSVQIIIYVITMKWLHFSPSIHNEISKTCFKQDFRV